MTPLAPVPGGNIYLPVALIGPGPTKMLALTFRLRVRRYQSENTMTNERESLGNTENFR